MTLPAPKAEATGREADLDELAAEATRRHQQVLAAHSDVVRYAIACGDTLRAAKDRCPHGAWLEWLAGNFPASESLARKYMALARNRERVIKMVESNPGLSLRAALHAISGAGLQPRQPPEEKATCFWGGTIRQQLGGPVSLSLPRPRCTPDNDSMPDPTSTPEPPRRNAEAEKQAATLKSVIKRLETLATTTHREIGVGILISAKERDELRQRIGPPMAVLGRLSNWLGQGV